jgi:hypothetical protein
MKRTKILLLILALCCILAACGKYQEAPTDPPLLYRHPFTGEPLDEPFTARPVVSTVNNHQGALPMSSISHADIFYEIETEAAVTRCLAFFTDLSEVGPIGSTRSARTYFNSIAYSYDAVLVHVGSSKYARSGQHDMMGNRLPVYDHIDWAYHPAYTYRDQDRINAGYAWEHTMFTTGEKLQQALTDLEFDMVIEEGIDYGLTFHEEPEMVGDSATNVVVTFPGTKTTTFVWNEDLGAYETYQFGEPWVDEGNDNTVLSFRNLIVMVAERWRPKGSNSFYELLGSGEGYFACDGKLIPILWSRNGDRDTFHFTLEDGTPLVQGIGNSYVALVPLKSNVKW